MTIIRHEDMRTIKFCNRGAREFCARHGINWELFIKHGIDESEVVGIDDEMLRQVIEQAKLREARGA